MTSNKNIAILLAVLTALGAVNLALGRAEEPQSPVSFAGSVLPIIAKRCLPCHAADSFNPSELSLDAYSDLINGGKHGSAVVPGKSAESLLIQKLGDMPPFGKAMPLRSRKNQEQKLLSLEEIQIIARWIDQGAKNN